MRPHTLASLCLALLAGACSPYVYKDEISGFASGLDAVGTAMNDARAGWRADRRALAVEGWSAQRGRIAVSSGCADDRPLTAGGKPCTLTGPFPYDPSGATLTLPPADESPADARNADAVLTALQAYAAGLNAITAAEDRQALDTATGNLATGIGDLAKAASPNLSASSLAAATDAFTLIGQVGGIVLDDIRYRRLREAVLKVEPMMSTFQGRVADGIRFETTRRALSLRDLVVAESKLYAAMPAGTSPAERQAAITRLAANGSALDAARRVDPAALAAGMASAHKALADALRDNAGQTIAVRDTITAFVKSADKLRRDLAGGT